MAVNFSEADHLFLDELADVRDVLTNDAEVTKLVYVINRIKSEIESLKQTKRDHKEFYDRKIEAANDQIEFLEGRIERYLDTKDQDSLPTPNGTVYFMERTKWEYPDEQTLLEFSKQKGIEYKVTEKPYKSKVKEYVEEGGETPEGMSAHTERTLAIRGSND